MNSVCRRAGQQQTRQFLWREIQSRRTVYHPRRAGRYAITTHSGPVLASRTTTLKSLSLPASRQLCWGKLPSRFSSEKPETQGGWCRQCNDSNPSPSWHRAIGFRTVQRVRQTSCEWAEPAVRRLSPIERKSRCACCGAGRSCLSGEPWRLASSQTSLVRTNILRLRRTRQSALGDRQPKR